MENNLKNEACKNAPEKKKGKSFIQLIKFALVGASNTLVDMLVNTGLSFVLNLFFSGNWIVYTAKTVGYGCGILNSYILNSRWTFKEERRQDKREILSFIAVNIAVLLISFGLIYLFKNVFRLNDFWMGLNLPAWLTKVITGDLFCSLLATFICIPVNFILNKLFVFKAKKPEEEEV
ncbi:MAG: GtrA family protein [Clostridiales bacterium]|nr:GtrA family protein [Clostridiales bacterium]